MKMMVNYSLLPLLLASPYKNSCSHSNQPLDTRAGQLDLVTRHRWLVAAPPFSLLSTHTPPAHARQSTPRAAPTPTPSQGQNSQMSSTKGKPGLSKQLQKARTTMSLQDLAVLKALGEEGGDCEGQALVILQDVSTRIATRT